MIDGQDPHAEDDVRRAAGNAAATRDALRDMKEARVVSALAAAASRLADGESELGREARALLAGSTGLSPEMVAWGLETSCRTVTEERLEGLLSGLATPPRALRRPSRLAALVLSGNVFSASLRAVLLPLLARVPVVAKASSRDDVFPRLLSRALCEVDPELARSYRVLTFEGGATRLEAALFAQADVVSAYGSDRTLADIRGRLPATTTFVPHGHGLGAIFVPSASMCDDRATLAIALDVAAYDQRGCLSPHGIWVAADESEARAFSERLAAALLEVEQTLPRGRLSVAEGGRQLQWRGVAAARGDLYEGDGYAVSFEGDGALRLSPGHRNVSVLTCNGPSDFARRVDPLGVHLKAVGLVGPAAARHELARTLSPPLAPRVSEVGTMQTPPLDSLADGQSPFTGLLRFAQID